MQINNQVLNVIKNGDATLPEISEKLSLDVYYILDIVKDLEKAGKIRISGLKNGEITYSIK